MAGERGGGHPEPPATLKPIPLTALMKVRVEGWVELYIATLHPPLGHAGGILDACMGGKRDRVGMRGDRCSSRKGLPALRQSRARGTDRAWPVPSPSSQCTAKMVPAYRTAEHSSPPPPGFRAE